MKKRIVGIGIVVILCLVFAYVFLVPDDWEQIMNVGWAFGDITDDKANGTKISYGAELLIDKNRYRKYKLEVNTAFIHGESEMCKIQIKDSEENILQEYEMEGDTFEEVLERNVTKKMNAIDVVDVNGNCKGWVDVNLYGKRTPFINITDLFVD